MSKLQTLFDKLDQHTTVLTPNRRLYLWLVQHYNQQQTTTSWQTPDILPLHSWLQRCWHTLAETSHEILPRLLSPLQELALWDSIIKSTVQTNTTAKAVQQAWQFIQQWEIAKHEWQTLTHEETIALLRWSETFVNRCQELNCIDHDRLCDHLLQHANNIAQLKHKKIILACFDELTPNLKSLFDRLQQRGVEIKSFDSKLTQTAEVHLHTCADSHTEITCMANWAKQKLKDGATHIACIVPQLNTQRNQVERIFKQHLTKQDFNISMGKPLIHYPMINDAFNLLKFSQTTRPLHEVSELLRSPFIKAAQQELHKRAKLDAYLHDKSYRQLNLTTLEEAALAHGQCQELIHCLQQHKARKPLALASKWAEYFSQTLVHFGWPGERIPSSEEYQIMQRWQTLLAEFASLDTIYDTVDATFALSKLQQLATDALFQTQTSDTPIQILGLLEGAGLVFDHMWVMGFDDQHWPAPARPNPFLPHALQRQYQLPHATADRELQFSQALLDRFCHSSKTLIISYASTDQQQSISPLLMDLSPMPIEAQDVTHAVHEAQTTIDLEIISETSLPVFTEQHAPGGSFLFKEQAACPFRAAAKLRLHADRLADVTIGLTGAQRGLLIHRSLEYIWKNIQQQYDLQHIEPSILKTIIQKGINKSCHQLQQCYPGIHNELCWRIERKRLQILLEKWLHLEKQRPPFKVLTQEQQYKLQIEGLTVQVRIDRLDQLDHDSYLVIDYKTGYSYLRDWFGEPPDEPQLPLYSLLAKEIVGVVIAQLRIEQLRFLGLTAYDTGIADVNEISEKTDRDWDTQRAIWKVNLEQLAIAFQRGVATVMPKHGAKTCQYCDLHTLCRIHEMSYE